MFSITLKTISYIFSVLIALASIGFLLALVLLVTKSDDLIYLAINTGIPIFVASALPWIMAVLGILFLGPITLICTNFFQQTKIIQLLEEQVTELRLARYERQSDTTEA